MQVIGPGAVLIAGPEVDPGLPLGFYPGHVAELSVDLCREQWGERKLGLGFWELRPGVLFPDSRREGGAGTTPSSSWQCSSPPTPPCPIASIPKLQGGKTGPGLALLLSESPPPFPR